MAGRLTTHAQDIVLGHGASGLKVWVRRLPDEEFGEVELDSAGRAVLLEGGRFEAGLYELHFRVGDYHRARGLVDGDAFLEDVPVRFRVADAAVSHHVPLLISLFGYSVYRGS
ncbi:MAG TPA: hydroxyisourate hydrolase [Caulobacteraceae bacterium]|jgi:5-hydroxyisourate hydrolase